MLFPLNTDAPIYYFPWATIGIIVVNSVVFLAMVSGSVGNVDDFKLVYGEGLHPVQWVTANFMHAGLWNLLGDMIYLWGFGLVVEGKIGWLRFVPIYLGIGVVECAIEQGLAQGLKEYSPDASGVIFGLMAMSLVWAPRNEMTIFVWLIRPKTFDMPILSFSFVYIVWEFLLAWLQGFGLSSSLLHVVGAALGFGVALAMLKFNLVDCENWDLLAVIAGREGKAAEEKPKARDREADEAPAKRQDTGEQTAAAVAQIQKLLADGHAAGSLALHRKMAETLRDWQLPEAELLNLIKGLHAAQSWSDSLRPMVEYLRRFPDKADRMRLKLAQILVDREKRPAKALDVLGKISASSLPAELDQVRRQLEDRANKLLASEDQGFEIDDEPW